MILKSMVLVGALGPARAGRQGEGEGSPCTELTRHANLAAMSGDDLADDRKSQPGPAAALCPRNSVEFLEDVGKMLGRNSFARIRDGQANCPFDGLGRQSHLAS